MKELVNVRQIPGESPRRWFTSAEFDLIVWLSEQQDFIGFELCYDKSRRERSIVWNRAGGYRHMAVDDGEQRCGKYKATPILVPDGAFDATEVHAKFLDASRLLPQDIAAFVSQKLARYPG